METDDLTQVDLNLQCTDNEDARQITSVPLFDMYDEQLLSPNLDTLDAENDNLIREELILFIARLYDLITIPRNKIDEIINHFTRLTTRILQNVKSKIDNRINLSPNGQVNCQDTSTIIDEIVLLMAEVKTERSRFKVFERKGTFILPQSIPIGERKEYYQQKGVTIYKKVPITSEFIPIRHVLKQFFEIPGLYDDTLANLKNLENTSNCFLKNFIQGSLWNEKKKIFGKKFMLPLFLYFDDYEPNNPLGSHKGLNKCGAVYLSIPCLPDIFRSKLENIFLFANFNTLDRDALRNDMIFSKVIKELQYLENEGIVISHFTKSKQIFFSLTLILGDNLGLNSILGFQEHFSSNFFCRFCLINYNEINNIFEEENCLMRDRLNYATHVEKQAPRLTGIKEECAFHKLPEYHVIDHPVVDVHHDLLEGILRYDIALILNYFIAQKYFTLNQLNDIIRGFPYDINDSNRPVEIPRLHLKNSCIIMSASEILCLMKNLVLMIGHLIPPKDDVWVLFFCLKGITDICVSSKLHINTPDVLKVEIYEYLTSHSRLFPHRLKPKHHYLLHYPRIMKLIGPLWNVSAMRFESKHQEGKQAARSAITRKNINHTIAIRHQLRLNYRLITKKNRYAEFDLGPPSRKLNDFPAFLLPHKATHENVIQLKWIKRGESLIKTGTIIMIPTEKETTFFCDCGILFCK
uniref:Uncharacterized protein n=1 Tax=Fopius arisanus TaxID=64838 RepID=A0A0C9QSB1_9HYME